MTGRPLPPLHAAYNEGVLAVLDVVKAAAAAIAATSKRHVHEAFAVAALEQLAEDGRALLIVPPSDPVAPIPEGPPSPPTPAAAELEVTS